jgi:BirA family transcriptional regulator, biotin operon repressor / biotin---[acetyl-CoA-carboxylase] ligase
MPDAPASWSSAPELDARLVDTRFRDIRFFNRIDSTNRYLLALAMGGAGDPPGGIATEGVVAVADEQTAGRGRHGRSWSATPGSALLVSVLLRPRVPAERLHLVTLAAAVAAAAAICTVAGFEVQIKWPNDLVVDDHKLAGILAEADGAGAVVLGIGINLRADSFPPDLSATATACDLHTIRPVERTELLVAWLRALDRELDHLDDIVAAAAARSATLGRRVRVELALEQFGGVAIRLTAEGYLVIGADDGTERVVTAGDVVHLRGDE